MTGLLADTRLIFGVFKLQTNKHLPLHMRRKTCPEKAIPLVFEIIPSTGTLLPGQHQNVQVKFTPREKVRSKMFELLYVLVAFELCGFFYFET